MKADLEKYRRFLENNGYETSLADNILAASKPVSGGTVNITIDAGGGCLVKVTKLGRSGTKRVQLGGRAWSAIERVEKTSQVRLVIASEKELKELVAWAEGKRLLATA